MVKSWSAFLVKESILSRLNNESNIMKIKSLCCAVVLLLICSCGKDDSPEPIKNNVPVIMDQGFTVSEDISDSETIGTIKATDIDKDELTFSITTNDNGLFEITNTGILTLVNGKALDYEVTKEHLIKVKVTDGIEEEEANITITVTNVIDTLAEDPDSFVTLWNIPENDFEIIIGTDSNYEYNYTIDWGDGTLEELTMQNPSHIYTSKGKYKVSIQGVFPAIKMGHTNLITEEGIEILKSLIGIEQWGTNIWESFNRAFSNCINMENHALDVPNLMNVEDMAGMFASFVFYELDFDSPSIFNADLSGWDVSNVTDMSGMFLRAELFNSDLSGWDVSNVTEMAGMFYEAKSFNSDLSNWNVSNVVNMSALFYNASSFNSNLSGWNVGNVIDMKGMFSGAKLFNADISMWDVSKVADMSNMFAYADLFNADISGWDVSNVTDMSYMFSGLKNFNIDIDTWQVGKVTKMTSMFAGAELFNADISSWNVGEVVTMASMFADAKSFNADISGWDVSNVTDMSAMFAEADSFNSDISNWNVSNVFNMLAMFAGADLFNIDISGWDIGNVQLMGVMFADAASFNQDLADWNISNVINMNDMLPNCGMSIENYSATLIGWANLANVPVNITLGATNMQYCLNGNAATARETLINNFGWTIEGDSAIDCD
ncbi:BspA family leucine-rich repeat surface protein [Flagellimonas pelagia]|uniref:BspA family leucine-rich repeat surface protein n=2 Tax=Flagellimonas pelagia TaxID=2306998 RepID=A0A3A1NCV3_9FLAO|nr:BspA family leucine-rich repeat surface protein [Allomuricauda maritima]TXJ91055.1 BspA family leucine-rich repeat surface protein [Allomuricauda maritima]